MKRTRGTSSRSACFRAAPLLCIVRREFVVLNDLNGFNWVLFAQEEKCSSFWCVVGLRGIWLRAGETRLDRREARSVRGEKPKPIGKDRAQAHDTSQIVSLTTDDGHVFKHMRKHFNINDYFALILNQMWEKCFLFCDPNKFYWVDGCSIQFRWLNRINHWHARLEFMCRPYSLGILIFFFNT